MSVKHTYSLSVKNDSGATVLAQSTVYLADAEENLSDIAPAGGHVQLDLVVKALEIVSFFIVSDQAVTVDTYTDVTHEQGPIALAAKIALWWNTDQPTGTNPITSDFNSIKFSNAGIVAANVRAGFLVAVAES